MFLQHFLAYNLKIAATNAFKTKVDKDVLMCRLFDTPSFFNHSCSPNVIHCIEGKRMYCIASRPIKRREHLCIDYIGFSKYIIKTERKQELGSRWDFSCRCVRCNNRDEIEQTRIDYFCGLSIPSIAAILSGADRWTTEVGAQIIAYQKKLEKSFSYATTRD